MNRRLLITRLACALLFLSLATPTIPRLAALVSTARTFLPLSWDERRERQMGPWYTSIEALRRQLPPSEPVALIARHHDTDSAVFANYYLFPIRTRLFSGRNDYRNAAPDPTRPKTIVVVTSDRVERAAYDAVRDSDLRAGHRVVSMPQLSEPETTFVLPIAASLDGPAPETFVIEATLANSGSAPAEVRATFWPAGEIRTITVAPGAIVNYYDLVHQLFGVLARGWMRIDSSQPLRAAFYFANRGHGDATLLPNVTGPATSVPEAPLYRDSKLFVLNPTDAPATAMLDGESIPITPHAFVERPIARVPRVSGNVYLFLTTRELNGRTDFLWPR